MSRRRRSGDADGDDRAGGSVRATHRRRLELHVVSHQRSLLPLYLSMVDRDFGPEDYERLIRLDDDNLRRGVDEAELAKCTTTFKTTRDARVHCCVCMEDCADGEDGRRLRCSHEFHAACVDRWLRDNRSCPVCKDDVSDG